MPRKLRSLPATYLSLRLKTRDGSTLKVVNDFKYLGSWVDMSKKDIKVRKALA